MVYKDSKALVSKGPAVFETLRLCDLGAYIIYFFSCFDKLGLLSLKQWKLGQGSFLNSLT